MKSFLKVLLGEYYVLAEQLVRSTLLFILMLSCIFVVRLVLSLLFPASENDYMSNLLHLVDAYATVLGIVGYLIWITLDMVLLLRQGRRRLFGKGKRL